MIPAIMAKASSAKDFLARVDRRLAALAIDGKKPTDRAISLAATGSPDTLRSIRRNVKDGKQLGVSTETVHKFVKPLKTTREWLTSSTGPEWSPDSHVDSSDILVDGHHARENMVRLVGYVGAGGKAHLYAIADQDFEEVEAPRGSSDQTVAVEIRGKSFGPLLDRWLVFYDDIRSPITDDLIGQVCVVGLSDDRILIKQIRRDRDGSYTLISNSTNEPPIEDVEIEWAAPVKDIRPRR